MDHSVPMEEYARAQLAKVITFLEHETEPIYVELVLEPSKVREHGKVTLLVRSPHYDRVSSYEHEGVGFYDVLDRVIDVMYRELHEDKKRLLDKRKESGRDTEFN